MPGKIYFIIRRGCPKSINFAVILSALGGSGSLRCSGAQHCINRLKSLQEDDYWMAIDFMNRLKHKNNSEEMAVVLAEFDKVKFNFDKLNEMKSLMDRFIKLVDQ